MDPLAALQRIAFLLERGRAPTHRVKAFRNAAAVVQAEGPALAERVRTGTLTQLPGIGPVTSAVISQAHAGEVPAYLAELQESERQLPELSDRGETLLVALRGDLHSHSDWSDGGSPVQEMVATAAALGRDYLAITDHSPRLRVANGLSVERLQAQLQLLDEVRGNLRDTSISVLSGIEVDILDDGGLDQTPELLATLDVVVASVHSKLRMDGGAMTRRLLAAVQDPNIDVLGHCTGRLLGDGPGAKPRPQSSFDAAAVFGECAARGVAIEINCRPERLDPPDDLLKLAGQSGCLFSMDTDAHAPGQLDWLAYGCERAVQAGIDPTQIVTTWPEAELLDWTRRAR